MSAVNPIRDASDYRAALARIRELRALPADPANRNELETLAALVDKYENGSQTIGLAGSLDRTRLAAGGNNINQADPVRLRGTGTLTAVEQNRPRRLSQKMSDHVTTAWSTLTANRPDLYQLAGGAKRTATQAAKAGALVAGVSCGIIAAAYFFYGRDLPDVAQLASYQPPSVVRTDDDGKVIVRREFVPLAQIPPHVVNAFLAAEDERFYAHDGFSPTAILKAVGRNISSSSTPTSGATITQQLVKNVLLTGKPRSIERKVQEIILAVRVENALSKDRILELYLNQISFGGSAFGVEVASRAYFGRSVRDLTVAQAAYLASIPKRPNDYRLDIAENQTRAKGRRDWVLTRMAEGGFITAATAKLAQAQPLSQTN